MTVLSWESINSYSLKYGRCKHKKNPTTLVGNGCKSKTPLPLNLGPPLEYFLYQSAPHYVKHSPARRLGSFKHKKNLLRRNVYSLQIEGVCFTTTTSTQNTYKYITS